MDYPGICTNGKPVSPIKFRGIKIMEYKRPSSKGKVELKFIAAGSYFLTSSVPGECDAKWMRVDVVA